MVRARAVRAGSPLGRYADELALDEAAGARESLARVAEPDGNGNWQVNQWLKKAVLLYFRTQEMELVEGYPAPYWDKVPARFADFDEAMSGAAAASGETAENMALLRDSEFFHFFLYTGSSIFIGLLATFAGIMLTKIL